MDFIVSEDYGLIEQEAEAQRKEYDSNTSVFDETGISLFRDSFFALNPHMEGE